MARKITIIDNGMLKGEDGYDEFRNKIGEWKLSSGKPYYKQKGKWDTSRYVNSTVSSWQGEMSNGTPVKMKIELVDRSASSRNIYLEDSKFYDFDQTIEIGVRMEGPDPVAYNPDPDDYPAIVAADKLKKFLAPVIDDASIAASAVYGEETLEDVGLDILKRNDFVAVANIPRRRAPNSEAAADVKFRFEYTDREYEKVLNRPGTKIIEIPSMNQMISRANLNDQVEAFLSAPSSVRLNYRLQCNMDYSEARNKFKKQMVIGDPTKTIGTWEDNKYLFPMYADIQVPLVGTKNLSSKVINSELGACLMRDITERGRAGVAKDVEDVNLYLESGKRTLPFRPAVNTFDLLDWWNGDGMASYATGRRLPEGSMFIHQGEPVEAMYDIVTGELLQEKREMTDEEKVASGAAIPGFVALRMEDFRGALHNLLRSKARDYEGLLRGETAHTETLLYKVVKHKGEDPDSPMQEFYFYNSSNDTEELDRRTFSFIDTQVKYGKDYTYVVTAYQAVVGTKYTYIDVDTQNMWTEEGYNYGKFTVRCSPTIKLFEIPLFKKTGRITVPPPYYPHVQIDPINGLSNGMLFFFDTQVGESYEEPISFNKQETKSNNQLLADSQYSIDNKILYKTTDAISGVQVFRTDEKPRSYMDFKGKRVMMIMTDRKNFSAGSIGKIIRQRPNEKFYYMFRSVGFHKEVSNPSPVYEVELFNDGGVTYPVVRLYEFPISDPKTTAKPMKNLLRIKPRKSHAMLNNEASGFISETGALKNAYADKAVLGLEEDGLFGKKFKIRLTSKATGKKIDLNVAFKTEVLRNSSQYDGGGLPCPDSSQPGQNTAYDDPYEFDTRSGIAVDPRDVFGDLAEQGLQGPDPGMGGDDTIGSGDGTGY